MCQNYQKSANTVNRFKKPNSDLKVIKAIKDKLSAEDLILCKADKGNTITIIEKAIYVKKIDEFICNNQLVKLSSDPTNKYQCNIKLALNNCKGLIDNRLKFKLVNPNPAAPILYGHLKLHKNDTPIRPIVSYINAPAYNLCKYMNSILRTHMRFEPIHTIKNSIELINKLEKQKYIPHAKLISFDVCSLFTSVPVEIVKNIIKNKLSTTNPVIANEILDLLEVCLDQNYCKFNDVSFKQIDGLPMGSPLSPLLADIFMDDLEVKVFTQSTSNKNIKWWYRYVDDIICLWTGTDRQLDMFLKFLNTVNNNIKFTLETESGGKLNFLDITISHNVNHFSYNIYRKNTYTDTIIPNSSNHPLNTKVASFNSMIHRLMHVPLSPAHFTTERNTIYKIASNNGFDTPIINKLIFKKQTKILNQKIYTPKDVSVNDKIYRRIPYLDNSSAIVANKLREYNITPAFYNKINLKKLLVNNKISSKNKLSNSGIYEISCENCKHIYIGKTVRNFSVRFKEHAAHCRLGKTQLSNVAKHMIEENHKCTLDNLKILHIYPKSLKLDTLEALEIYKAVKSNCLLMNEQLELNNSPLLKIF